MHVLRQVSDKESQIGWESIKGKEICSGKLTHNTAAVDPEGARHRPCDKMLRQCWSLFNPCLCLCRPLATQGLLARLGRKGLRSAEKGVPAIASPPRLPSRPCPALMCAPGWENTLNQLAMAGSASASGCAEQEQPFCPSCSAVSSY